MTDLPEGTHRSIDDPNRDDTRVVAGNARLLGYALERAAMPRPPDHEAHHIVLVSHRDAAGHCEAAREILAASGVGVNDAENGIWLPRTSRTSRGIAAVRSDAASSHDNIHTRIYFEALQRELLRAYESTGPEGVRMQLASIRMRIEQGTFPH
jgi:hypothetical protein